MILVLPADGLYPRAYPNTWADPGKLDQAFWEFYLFVFVFSSAHSLRECELWNTLQSNNFLLLRFKIAIIIVNYKLKEVVEWFVGIIIIVNARI